MMVNIGLLVLPLLVEVLQIPVLVPGCSLVGCRGIRACASMLAYRCVSLFFMMQPVESSDRYTTHHNIILMGQFVSC